MRGGRRSSWWEREKGRWCGERRKIQGRCEAVRLW